MHIRLRRAFALEPQGQRRNKVSARAVAGDREARAVSAECVRIGGCPSPRGLDVVERRGIHVLGREPVIDRDDDRAESVGEDTAKLVVRVE